MRRLLLLLFTLTYCCVQAQFYKSLVSFDKYYVQPFNATYMLAHKVKSVNISFASKEDGQRIQIKNSGKKITFNQAGYPEKELSYNLGDSSETFYYYSNTKLNVVRKFSASEIQATYLGFDSLGNKIKEVHCHEQAANKGEEDYSNAYFKLGKQVIDWTETYSYQELSKNQLRKQSLNDKGIVFKEGIIYSNENSLVTSVSERYTITGISENYKYVYDSKGNMLEKIFFTDVSGELEEKTIFTYEANGNLANEKIYRNGILLRELIYFYTTKGDFPEAILTKYPNRKTIDMQNITVEFY